ncbi:hypothetical protein PG987_006426 [Apiospora arundinis]
MAIARRREGPQGRRVVRPARRTRLYPSAQRRARVAAGTLIYVWPPPGSSSPRCGDVRKLLQGSSWRYRVATAAAGPAAGRRRGGPGPPPGGLDRCAEASTVA